MEKVDLADLHPTQFSYGAHEVDLKRGKLDKLAEKEGALDRYKRKHPGLVVRGPGGRLYLLDGHHLARALLDRGSRRMYVTVHADWSHLTPEEFGERMVEGKLCYLRDRGFSRPWEHLPNSLDQMTDDPFRTLAWLVREEGGYTQLSQPFQEFAWAEYFRARLAIHARPSWKELTKKGIDLAKKPEASGLPGWNGKERCATLVAANGIAARRSESVEDN